MKKYVSEEGWTEVTCDCGSLMKEFTAFRSVSVFCCFDCFDLSTKTGKFFADIEWHQTCWNNCNTVRCFQRGRGGYMTEFFIYYEPYSDIRGEIDMVSFKHYKWKVVPAALKGLHNSYGRGETFNSQTIAREASKLGRSNSELTSRQIGACLLYTSPSPRDQ